MYVGTGQTHRNFSHGRAITEVTAMLPNCEGGIQSMVVTPSRGHIRSATGVAKRDYGKSMPRKCTVNSEKAFITDDLRHAYSANMFCILYYRLYFHIRLYTNLYEVFVLPVWL